MNDRSVRDMLDRAADLSGDDFVRPTVAQFRERRRTRRRSLAAMIASTGVVLLVIVLGVVLARGRASRPPADHTVFETPAPGRVTAAELQHYHWSTLPPAPIVARPSAASVWTGTQMIVWGGESDSRYFADGAAYTPSTRQWQTLPRSPLAPQADPLAVWTGSRMIIWGGERAHGRRHNGATYDPATRQWQVMPAAPILPGDDDDNHDLIWTGHEAVLLSLNKDFAATTMDAAAYDPATNRWVTLPSIDIKPSNNYTGATAAVVGHRLIAWISSYGAFALNPAWTTWTRVPLAPVIAGCIYTAIPVPRHIIFPGSYSSVSCGGDLAVQAGTRGVQLDRRSGRARHIAYTPTSDGDATTVWTGAALLNADASAFQVPGGRGTAGTTASWDPRTNTWLTLPSAPATDNGVTWEWTGTQLIGWGTFTPARPGTEPPTGLTLET